MGISKLCQMYAPVIYRHALKKITYRNSLRLRVEGVCVPSGVKEICAVRRKPVCVHCGHWPPRWHFLGHASKLIAACEEFVSKTSIWLVFLFQFVPIFLCTLFIIVTVGVSSDLQFYSVYILLHDHFLPEGLSIFVYISAMFLDATFLIK